MSSLLAVLLPCLVSGYLLANARIFRVRFPETTESNLYFRILAIGFFWVFGLGVALLVGDDFSEDMQRYMQQHIFGMPLAAVLIVVFALMARKLIDIVAPVSSLQILWHQARYLECFIAESIRKGQLVMVTLDNAKVYVCRIKETTFSKKAPEWLIVLPFISGYRCDPDKNIRLTTSYIEAYAQADRKHLKDSPSMILQVKDIISIQVFDSELYRISQEQAMVRTGAEE